MKSQKGIAPILIIILVAVAVFVYLIYSGKIIIRPSQQTIPYDIYKASPMPTGSAETANQRDYFTIKYPNSWSLVKGKILNAVLLSDTTLTKNSRDQEILIQIFNSTDRPAGGKPTRTRNVVIDGTTAKAIFYSGGEAGTVNKEEVSLKRGGLNYFILVNNYKNEDFNETDQILSTFKFIDQNQTMRCADTYKDLQEALKNPQQVCYLDLSRNNLIELPKEVLQFSNLKVLYLNFNKITTLPNEIKNFKNLTTIDLTGNSITVEEVNKLRNLLPKVNILNIQPMNYPQ